MPRFVVLEHTQGDAAHFDLMLEHEGVLLTWSFAAFPTSGSRCKCLPDHPLRFLSYEGPLNAAPGVVRRVDSGSFDLLARTPDAVGVTLRGGRLSGSFTSTRTPDGAWTFDAT